MKRISQKKTNQTFLKLAALVGGILCFSAISLSSNADTTLYEISKGNQKLFLGGTIHLLRSEDFPPPTEFDTAYEQASTLIFETDIAKAQSKEFSEKFMKAMILPNNQTLKDVLNESTWKDLQNYAIQNNYPLSQTMMFNPAFSSVLITVTALQKMGVSQGIDNFYYQKALTNHKTLGELETGDQAIEAMKEFNQEDANKIISTTLDDMQSATDDFSLMISAWRKGDLKTLDHELGQRMKNNLPGAYQAIVLKRNMAWLPQIEAMLKTPEVEMVLVGSLHLSGDQGLISLLKKDGYKVKPVHLATH